jgi:hypothetical protein
MTAIEPTETTETTETTEPTETSGLTGAAPEIIPPADTTAASLTAASATSTRAASPSPAASLAGQDALAAWLAQTRPSAGRLDELVCGRLSAAGCLDAVVGWERLVRHANAGLIRALAALVHVEGDAPASAHPLALVVDGMDLAEMEVCAALAWSPSRAQARLTEADVLTRLFPATLEHLSEGGIALEQARCLAELTGGLEDDAAKAVQSWVLARMPGQRLTATRQAIRRAIVRADPQAAAHRHRYERARRRVELRPEDDGMATLSFYLPADIAQMAMRTLTAMAQRAKRAGKDDDDQRTLDQRRADMLPALLTHACGASAAEHATGTSGGAFEAGAPIAAARVNVVVGIETLLGLSHEPGHLQGYGPIGPEQTRLIAHGQGARWRFLLTSSDGTVAEASARTYTPGAALKRLTELTFTTCAFPNCTMPAERCDLDHNQPHHKGGATCLGNLVPLCRTHHNAKSFGHWTLERRGETIHWVSAHTDHAYTTTSTRYQPTPTPPAVILG